LLEVNAGGSSVATVPLGDAWSETFVPLDHVPHGVRFICELRVLPPEFTNPEFDDFRFAVKDREFV
jgi:hypothetical protein